MNNIYFCIGSTNSYGYDHGMVSYDFIETDDKTAALERAFELSNEVIEDYMYIFKDEYDNEEDVYSEESCSEYYLVDLSCDDIDDLFDMVDEYGIEDFIDKFCKEVE